MEIEIKKWEEAKQKKKTEIFLLCLFILTYVTFPGQKEECELITQRPQRPDDHARMRPWKACFVWLFFLSRCFSFFCPATVNVKMSQTLSLAEKTATLKLWSKKVERWKKGGTEKMPSGGRRNEKKRCAQIDMQPKVSSASSQLCNIKMKPKFQNLPPRKMMKNLFKYLNGEKKGLAKKEGIGVFFWFLQLDDKKVGSMPHFTLCDRDFHHQKACFQKRQRAAGRQSLWGPCWRPKIAAIFASQDRSRQCREREPTSRG